MLNLKLYSELWSCERRNGRGSLKRRRIYQIRCWYGEPSNPLPMVDLVIKAELEGFLEANVDDVSR